MSAEIITGADGFERNLDDLTPESQDYLDSLISDFKAWKASHNLGTSDGTDGRGSIHDQFEWFLADFQLTWALLSERLQTNKQVRERQEAAKQEAAAAVAEFQAEHPEIVNCDSNKNAVANYLLEHGLPVTFDNLQSAFNALQSELVLQSVPAREKIYRNGRVVYEGEGRSSLPGSSALGGPVGELYSKISQMDAREYEKRLRDPNFRHAIDGYSRKPVSKIISR
jgi:hypothetical protein